jgi:hypothetical protein
MVLVAALAFATPALAGFTLPYSSGVCAGVFAPLDSIDDPNTFAGSVKCADLCNATERDCEKYVKDAFACEINHANDDRDYSNKECVNNVTPDAIKSCRVTAAAMAQGRRDGARADRDTAISQCKVWGASCLVDCGP